MMKSTQGFNEAIEEFYQENFEGEPIKKCRLCWKEQDVLISPCRCSGNQAYVHISCLSDQIEKARIMKVANLDGFYNSRCPLCKDHIQFKIQEYNCSFNRKDILQAFKRLDQDTTAWLSVNMSILAALVIIITLILVGHWKTGWRIDGNLNYSTLVLEGLVTVAIFILGRIIWRNWPSKIRKPLLTKQEN